MVRLLAALVLVLLAGAPPVLASDRDFATPPETAGQAIQLPDPVAVSQRRPAILPALYGGLVALQVLDGYTTTGARARGAYEMNPVLGEGRTATLWAVKAASTASTIYFVERIWKKNRVAAVLVMAGINSGYAAIAAHNTRQSR